MQQLRRTPTAAEVAACEAQAFLNSYESSDPTQGTRRLRPVGPVFEGSDRDTLISEAPAPRFRQNDTLIDATGLTPLCAARIEYVRDWNLPERDVVVLIFGVPVLVLGLGAITAWAARGFRAKFDPERASSYIQEKPADLLRQNRKLKQMWLALALVAIAVTATITVYEIKNSYANCILRNMPGAPANAVTLIRQSCRDIAR